MDSINVLKFGSSVLRRQEDLPIAVDEIYRRYRSGSRVIAVVSAFEGITDQLLSTAAAVLGSQSPKGTAAYVATGELQTASLLAGWLEKSGIPARLVEPATVGLQAKGSALDSEPMSVDEASFDRLWKEARVIVLPGFYGLNRAGELMLFGRGGTDFSALFLAAKLRARAHLVKDVPGVFNEDPTNDGARCFAQIPWARAIEVAGPLIQLKALRAAERFEVAFTVGRANEATSTLVGPLPEQFRVLPKRARPLRVVLLGLGVVGRGVYERLRLYGSQFEVVATVVRNPAKHPDVPPEILSIDTSRALDPSIDVVVECRGGTDIGVVLASVLDCERYVVTANKAAVAAHWRHLAPFATGPHPRLLFSAAVCGAVPVLEAVTARAGAIREIRGIVNATCNYALDECARGRTLNEAVASAQAAGFAEADPSHDLSGRDAADKLSLLIAAAFNQWVPPAEIPCRGIDQLGGAPAGIRLVAWARCVDGKVTAAVEPSRPVAGGFLATTPGAENRLELELTTGKLIQLRGQGAGRWPTAVSVMADLHAISRRFELQDDIARAPGSTPCPIHADTLQCGGTSLAHRAG